MRKWYANTVSLERSAAITFFLETDFERQHSTTMPRQKTRKYPNSVSHRKQLRHSPFTIAACSVANERHPTRNEDSILLDERSGVAAVFDGVGGSAAGEIASRIATFATRQGWTHLLKQLQKNRRIPSILACCDNLNLCALLQHLLLEADEQVRTEGARRAGTDDLATTVALTAFCKQPDSGSYTMVYAHVGDSRVYLLHGQERLKRLTNDDGLLAKLVENKIINEAEALRIDQAVHANQLSDTELSYFKLRGGITQALGGTLPPTVHINYTTIHPGDRILLCTDGIHDNLVDEEIEAILRNTPRSSTARALIEHSILRSHQERSETIRAKPDDMSAIVLTCRY